MGYVFSSIQGNEVVLWLWLQPNKEAFRWMGEEAQACFECRPDLCNELLEDRLSDFRLVAGVQVHPRESQCRQCLCEVGAVAHRSRLSVGITGFRDRSEPPIC